jgi:uncharacterized protein YbjT (DUF2867 family)
MSSTRTVAVTGASGFVGRSIVSELLSRGFHVRALVRDREKARAVLPRRNDDALRLVIGDVADAPRVADLVAGTHACIHLIGIIRESRDMASGRALTFRQIHVEATRTVLEACVSHGVTRYIHMSALGVTPNGVSDYQKSKFEAESIVRMSDREWTIFRPGLIHGPGGEFVQMMKKVITGEMPPYLFMPYFTRGIEDKRVPLGPVHHEDPIVQPVAVEDVARAFVGSIDNPATHGEVYNLVGPEALPWPAMLRFMRDALHAGKIEPFGLPGEVAALGAIAAQRLGMGGMIPFDAGMARMGAQDATASLDKARADLDFRPRAFRETFAAYAGSL